jgi:hypothetical protein
MSVVPTLLHVVQTPVCWPSKIYDWSRRKSLITLNFLNHWNVSRCLDNH